MYTTYDETVQEIGYRLESPRTKIFGISVDDVTKASALNTIDEYLMSGGRGNPKRIFFTNVHTICIARRDHEFAESINRAEMILPDGSGIKIAGKVLLRRHFENLNGTDLTPIVLKMASEKGWSVYFLGARFNALVKCIDNVRKTFPKLKVAGYREGYFGQSENNEVVAGINKAHPGILLVGMGSPIQELWITRNLPLLDVKACFAIGGLFDFLSGEKKRAPVWMRKTGIEWIFRFLHDPLAKWQRVLIEIPGFLVRVFLVKISSTVKFFHLNPSGENLESVLPKESK